MSEWKPIETAPMWKDMLIVVKNERGENIVESGYRNNIGFSSHRGLIKHTATHWMHLPKPPEDKS